MMTFLSVLLMIALVLDSLLLILLVLIQLPKKEAGAGLAFGGGATDALFGAGSGNTLTRITKWSAGIFFGLALALSVMNSYASRTGVELKNAVAKPPPGASANPGPTALPPATNAPATPATTNPEMQMLSTTNTLSHGAATNAPAPPPK